MKDLLTSASDGTDLVTNVEAFQFLGGEAKPNGTVQSGFATETLQGTSARDVIFFDTAFGLKLGADTLAGFDAGDRFVPRRSCTTATTMAASRRPPIASYCPTRSTMRYQTRTLHLGDIATTVAPGAHTVLLLDQAGWYTTKVLPVLDNITMLPLPRHSPELNTVENLWRFLRNNWLSNSIFQSFADIDDQCGEARTKLIAQRRRIMSIERHQWTH